MKTLISIVALAVVLAWPSIGDAASKKSSARGKAAAKHYVQRPAKAARRDTAPHQRSVSQEPCARRVWWGCTGWDPDPNIRDMLARDVGDDN